MQKRVNIVGSGPNGLSAAIALAQAGAHVTVYEAADTPGGCVHSAALTLPGFTHDMGAAVFPLTVASPFLRTLPLHEHGVQWIYPEVPLAHPLAGGDAVALFADINATAELLGSDGRAWVKMLHHLIDAKSIYADLLAPPIRVPRHPLTMLRFAGMALQPALKLAQSRFRNGRTQTLFAGLAAHTGVPLDYSATSASALVLAMSAHRTGWPIPRGGAQTVAAALVSLLRQLGGDVVTGYTVHSLSSLPPSDAVLLDVAPESMQSLADAPLPTYNATRYADVRRGPGVFKMDWALNAPIPWRDDVCRRAGTVHIGASLAGIQAAEQAAWQGHDHDAPFIILSQPSVFDPTRAPEGKHTAWAYCHVAARSRSDMSDIIEALIERHAPGFKAAILGRASASAPAMEAWNPNLVGGDISGGAMTLPQTLNRLPYTTFLPGVFLCSSSTAPGGGVHGMCGYYAGAAAARYMGLRLPRLGAQAAI